MRGACSVYNRIVTTRVDPTPQVRLALSGAAGQRHGWSKGLTKGFNCELYSYQLSAVEVQRTACRQHWKWLELMSVEAVHVVGLVYEMHLARNVHAGLELLRQNMQLAVHEVQAPRHGLRCSLQQTIQGFESFKAKFPKPINFMVSDSANATHESENVTFSTFVTRIDTFCQSHNEI